MEKSHSHIVRALYRGVLNAGEWHSAVEMIRQLANGEQAMLLIRDQRSRQSFVTDIARPDQRMIDQFQAHYSHNDPIYEVVANNSSCAWFLDRRDLEEQTVRKHPFFQEFLRPHGIGSILALTLQKDPFCVGALGVQRGCTAAPFDDADQALLQPLAPHLLRAVRLRQEVDRLNCITQKSQAMLDHLAVPLFGINGSGRMVFANAAAHEWMESMAEQTTRMTAGGLLDLLGKIGKEVCAAKSLGLSSARITDNGTEPGYLIGLLLQEGHAMTAPRDEPLALVFAHRSQGPMTSALVAMQQLFGLTAAEIRVMQALAKGLDIAQVAAACHLSRETVKSQLKSIFLKTRCQKQAGLQRLVAQLGQVHRTQRGVSGSRFSTSIGAFDSSGQVKE
jgi:DNA-binding CsgD family transcriptional regulator/PAS domain-containing protein